MTKRSIDPRRLVVEIGEPTLAGPSPIVVDGDRVGTLARDDEGEYHFDPDPGQRDQFRHSSPALGEMIGIVLERVYADLAERPSAHNITHERSEQRAHTEFVPKALDAVAAIAREKFEHVVVDGDEIFFDWVCDGGSVEFCTYVSGWGVRLAAAPEAPKT